MADSGGIPTVLSRLEAARAADETIEVVHRSSHGEHCSAVLVLGSDRWQSRKPRSLAAQRLSRPAMSAWTSTARQGRPRSSGMADESS
jgi:hypothetical protein